MKDQEARDNIKELQDSVTRLNELTGGLNDLSVRDCPKCKHPTLQQARYTPYSFTWVGTSLDYRQCLTCGSKIVCIDKTVCKVLKEEKDERKT